MNAPASDSWHDLFAPVDKPANVSHSLFEIRRGGAPWLLLPRNKSAAVRSLALYPAQSSRARFAKKLLAMALSAGLRPGLRQIDFAVAEDDAFSAFLRDAAGTPRLPDFAVLAGNPRAPGRRFVFLLFDDSGEPRVVVKAGATASARELIEREENFLRAKPQRAVGIPELRNSFASDRVRAFAMNFVEGDSPRHNTSLLKETLRSWVWPDRLVHLKELPAWQKLRATMSDAPRWIVALEKERFHPALMHGDFAPWNVKANARGWTVLDWERGELQGLPAWDWFHFEIQPALLVRHESAAQLLSRAERLLQSPDFSDYANAAGIAGCTREFFLAYVANCLRVTKQTEGGNCLRELEQLAERAWR